MEWSQVASTAMTSIFSSSFIMALVAMYTAKQSRNARVSGDEREARKDLIMDSDKLLERYSVEVELLYTENKLLKNYVYELRGKIDNPPPFPEGLKRI